MFDLDIRIFSFILKKCAILGGAFGFGAFEGFVMYAGVIMLGIVKVLENRTKKVQR